VSNGTFDPGFSGQEYLDTKLEAKGFKEPCCGGCAGGGSCSDKQRDVPVISQSTPPTGSTPLPGTLPTPDLPPPPPPGGFCDCCVEDVNWFYRHDTPVTRHRTHDPFRDYVVQHPRIRTLTEPKSDKKGVPIPGRDHWYQESGGAGRRFCGFQFEVEAYLKYYGVDELCRCRFEWWEYNDTQMPTHDGKLAPANKWKDRYDLPPKARESSNPTWYAYESDPTPCPRSPEYINVYDAPGISFDYAEAKWAFPRCAEGVIVVRISSCEEAFCEIESIQIRCHWWARVDKGGKCEGEMHCGQETTNLESFGAQPSDEAGFGKKCKPEENWKPRG
jgi:hypothetical protein